MSNLQEVPTEELLSFHDYPTVHNINNTTIPISATQTEGFRSENNFDNAPTLEANDTSDTDQTPPSSKAFWTLEYYQKYFDVDTKDVTERILASVTPKWDNTLKHHLRTKPDLYGPFWICVTLIFALAISGNVASYLHTASINQRYKYDFHMVSIAATVISLYVTLIPTILWGLLKWSSQINDIEGLSTEITPGALELVCVYGYSLFIYIPASIVWSIQINWLQWSLVFVSTIISGSVLLLTVMPALRLSKHKILLSIGIICCHLLLSVGFMLYFFHDPYTPATQATITDIVSSTNNSSNNSAISSKSA